MADLPPLPDFGEVKDATAYINMAAKEMEAAFANISEDSKNFEKILSVVAQTMDDIPDKLRRGDRLMQAMVEDSKLFEKVQGRTFSMISKKLEEAWNKVEKAVELEKEGRATVEEISNLYSEFNKLAEENAKILKGDFDNLKGASEEIEKQVDGFEDIKKILDDMGAKIRSPSQAAEGMLGSLSKLPQHLLQAKEETGSWGGALKDVAGSSKLGQIAKMVGKGGPIIIGIMAITAALVVLYKLIKNYYEFLDKKIMPAQADFNKELGNTGASADKLKGQAASMGVQFELLGMDFHEGAKMVREFSAGMLSVEPFDKETMLAAENLVGVLGMGGEAAGKFALQFQKQDGNLKMLHKSMIQAEKDANALGIPVATIQKDMAESPDILARFGTAAAMEFEKSTIRARMLGMSIKEVNTAFGDQLDTFEGSAEAAAKLNTIFGTQINSFELMMETNPEKRMMMLREELVAQGKSWNDLNVFEKNMISTTLKVDKAQAALILSSEEERKKLQAKMDARKRDEQTQIQWERGIKRLQRTLIAWNEELNLLMRSVTDLVFAMFGFDKPGKEISSVTKMLTVGMRVLTTWVQKQADAWRKGGDELSPFLKMVKGGISILKALAKTTDYILLPFTGLIKIITKLLEKLGLMQPMMDINKSIFESLATAVHEVGKFLEELDFDKVKEFTQSVGSAFLGLHEKAFEFAKKTVTGSVNDAILKDNKVVEINPSDTVIAAKTIPGLQAGVAKAAGGTGMGGGNVEVVLRIEGSDELAEVLSKVISVKQVKRARY